MKPKGLIQKIRNQIRTDEPVSILDVLKQSVRLYGQNLVLFISIVAISALPELTRIALSIRSMPSLVVSMIFSAVLGVFAAVALITAVSDRYIGAPISLRQAFAKSWGRNRIYFVNSLMFGLTFAAGLVLFVLPGLYWGTIFLLVPVIAVLEKRSDPFRMSEDLVRGSFVRIFLLFLVFTALGFGFQLFLRAMHYDPVSSVGLNTVVRTVLHCLLFPLQIAIQVVLFYRLKERADRMAGGGN